jgi:IMP and pyridine-specific 5'-nucleotidase
VKGLLAVPFVLLSQPTAVHESSRPDVATMAVNAHSRYAQIMKDVEDLILDHIAHQRSGTAHASKLKLLVPSVGTFFTPLPLQDAFNYQDAKRCISSRRFVPPSFNDIRLVLNTAQAMAIIRNSSLDLVTFDGDVTLYDDGESLTPTPSSHASWPSCATARVSASSPPPATSKRTSTTSVCTACSTP